MKSGKLYLLFALMGMVASAVCSRAYADREEHHRLKPTLGLSYQDFYGSSVSIDGDTAVIGAGENYDKGSAYVFDAPARDHQRTLTGSSSGEWFGDSVSLSGSTTIIGDSAFWVGGDCVGAAYIFDVSTGNLAATLTASDGEDDDYFGCSVSIDGDYAVVGADWHDHEPGGYRPGAAYVYSRSGSVWGSETELNVTAPDTVGGFGKSVSISGNVALIGADQGTDGVSGYTGAAYLFSASTGSETAKLTASDAATDDDFGWSVAIDGDLAVIGAPGNDDDGSNSGAAYIFKYVAGVGWGQAAKLTASDAAAGDKFGSSVSISDELAVIGAEYGDGISSNTGAAYLFTLDDDTWTETGKLVASDGTSSDYFGRSVSISGDRVVVGAPERTVQGDSGGAAYYFDVPLYPLDLTADFDSDEDVDADDIDILCDNIGDTTGTYDLDGDDDCDEDDQIYLVNHYVQFDSNRDGEYDGQGSLRADFNLDGYVNATDLAIMKGSFGQTGIGYADGNANCDTYVNATDLAIMKGTFGEVAWEQTGGGGVPEPATMSLLGLGGAALLRRRRKQGSQRERKRLTLLQGQTRMKTKASALLTIGVVLSLAASAGLAADTLLLTTTHYKLWREDLGSVGSGAEGLYAYKFYVVNTSGNSGYNPDTIDCDYFNYEGVVSPNGHIHQHHSSTFGLTSVKESDIYATDIDSYWLVSGIISVGNLSETYATASSSEPSDHPNEILRLYADTDYGDHMGGTFSANDQGGSTQTRWDLLHIATDGSTGLADIGLDFFVSGIAGGDEISYNAPEPATLSLLVLGAVGMLKRRKK